MTGEASGPRKEGKVLQNTARKRLGVQVPSVSSSLSILRTHPQPSVSYSYRHFHLVNVPIDQKNTFETKSISSILRPLLCHLRTSFEVHKQRKLTKGERAQSFHDHERRHFSRHLYSGFLFTRSPFLNLFLAAFFAFYTFRFRFSFVLLLFSNQGREKGTPT